MLPKKSKDTFFSFAFSNFSSLSPPYKQMHQCFWVKIDSYTSILLYYRKIGMLYSLGRDKPL